MDLSEVALEIRPSTSAEVDLAVAWAAQEGWNPGLHDAECYRAADPQAFLIATRQGEPVATISVVRYDDRFGFLGFYIVHPEHRGRGYGMQIWKAGLDYLHGCSVGLDGVVEQIENYRKSGFQYAYRHLRYACPGGGLDGATENVVPLVDVPFEELQRYDADFFPAARVGFLRHWIGQPQARALGVLEDGSLRGYGVIRPCLKGAKIGPLYADDPAVADRLFRALRGGLTADQEVYLDVPDCNRPALALAERAAMEVQFECARMYRGETPQLPTERIYGVTSMEIG